MDKGCKKQSVKEIEQKLEPGHQHLRQQVLAWLYPWYSKLQNVAV